MPLRTQAQRILSLAETGDSIALLLIGREKLFCGLLSFITF